jgi:hypothetical protein
LGTVLGEMQVEHVIAAEEMLEVSLGVYYEIGF